MRYSHLHYDAVSCRYGSGCSCHACEFMCQLMLTLSRLQIWLNYPASKSPHVVHTAPTSSVKEQVRVKPGGDRATDIKKPHLVMATHVTARADNARLSPVDPQIHVSSGATAFDMHTGAVSFVGMCAAHDAASRVNVRRLPRLRTTPVHMACWTACNCMHVSAPRRLGSPEWAHLLPLSLKQPSLKPGITSVYSAA
jgi:hypothetical protein